MLTGIEQRRCRSCGKEFLFLRGGFVYRMVPICDECRKRGVHEANFPFHRLKRFWR